MAAIAARVGARLGPQLLKSAPSMLSGMGGVPGASGPASGPAASGPTIGSGIAGALTEKDVLRTVEDMRRAETMELIEKAKLKAMQKMAKGNGGLFLLTFLKDLSPYLVLALVILVIIMLISGGGGSSAAPASASSTDPKKRQAFRSVKSKTSRIIDSIREKLRVVIAFFTPGYRTRTFFSMFSPMGPTYNAIPRPQMRSGRCDNLRWIQINNDRSKTAVLNMDGQVGKCYSALRPNNIVWELDPSNMSELYELPDKRQDDIKSNMTVTIPYTSDESVKDGNTFFYPRCDAAYYGNDPKNKADMFEDLGTSCKMKVHPLLKSKYSIDQKTKYLFVNGKRIFG